MNASRGARGEVEDEAREEAFLDRLVRRARRVGAGDGRKGEMRRRSEKVRAAREEVWGGGAYTLTQIHSRRRSGMIRA